MKYGDEASIMRALDIDSWRNLSKDKIVKFAAMMPDMDKEVALKIIEQFPEFRLFAADSVGAMEKAHSATISANRDSQENVHKAYQDIRSILAGELKDENLTWEQKQHIYGLLMETGEKDNETHVGTQRSLGSWLKNVGTVVGLSVLAGVVFVGGRMLLETRDGTESNTDTVDT